MRPSNELEELKSPHVYAKRPDGTMGYMPAASKPESTPDSTPKAPAVPMAKLEVPKK